MTKQEEREMHELAKQLEDLTRADYGWEASRYWEIAVTMKKLTEYCPTCDCQVTAKK